MTGASSSIPSKMFRWLKDKKNRKQDRKQRPEDDYGFRKRQIILQETENGHSVIIKDDETTVVYPQSFCKFHFRARMPTPVQNVKETSSHIYDEIPESIVRNRLGVGASHVNDADLIKDTRAATAPMLNSRVDLNNAIEVGPYLIVPIVNPNTGTKNGDVEIFKRNSDPCGKNADFPICHCQEIGCFECKVTDLRNDPSQTWSSQIPGDAIKDAKIVLTRCVKSKQGLKDATNVQPENEVLRSDLCSNSNGAQSQNNTQCAFRIFADSPSNDSNSRTLTPVSSPQTPDNLSDRPESCAITDDEIVATEKEAKDISSTSPKPKSAFRLKEHDGNETGYEYDLSTSGGSAQSRDGERVTDRKDYEDYLSKIESNLLHKQNVRKIVHGIDNINIDNCAENCDSSDIASMTYVSSLSEYSSATSHISGNSADNSCSDESSGYFECLDKTPGAITKTRCSPNSKQRTGLERSLSMPSERQPSKKKVSKRHKDKSISKTNATKTDRSKSFDSRIYKALSDEDRELYKFPSASNTGSSVRSRHGRGKPVPLAPQPTPVYMDPYRGKSRSHNRLLGDLIRMNYDKQLFFH
ncbi:uncharacterized protein LOC127859306 [Dreissena polymorpha]|uniref:Uncharacterized protein n=1 Tax=Dreissena polymorpha TaxID=45954 RepID=A0A9D3YIX4_DREPO|nr:uncharacterized protein LOC127859306 [Dreissena polymorpha]XP_052252528.1 uncharacterized protein LOC127859306 [Dreissena polymorpha]XP_052252529.1 uncharacterized protein LOC127859306 [Dreissena polymorpha]XP_052252530.1 uncharacterized protein LOC127859306 [Dreissena polymorpha]XP_052252532.1 uncharacterized protein LOC127859306 [Dreissena polymorpha]XP_052252533.1 uncharacterized protein LOC127859306 [Dreissena polymorpha]KAH3699623.1 hypothetical protein DPMN_074581 [Dreissena polymorp